MSRNIFFASDHHMGHSSVWEKFKGPDGVTPLRPFSSTEEMNQTIIDNHRRVVGSEDKVYFLGDFTVNKKYIEMARAFNGKKRLVLGNHDDAPINRYLEVGFQKVMAYRNFGNDFICSHIPIYPDGIGRFGSCVHGHLHGNRVMWKQYGQDRIDPRFYSVCMEQIDYTPISYEDLMLAIKKQEDEAGYTRPVFGKRNAAD